MVRLRGDGTEHAEVIQSREHPAKAAMKTLRELVLGSGVVRGIAAAALAAGAVLAGCADKPRFAPTTTPAAAAAPAPLPAAPDAPAWQLDWAKGIVFYQVFVRSFCDASGDGVGDLNGLIAKLDYLQDLGIEGLWLMPVFESPSYHGYDVVDYETVNEDYGTNADFERLMVEAHKRGIRVIVDFVVNHTSSDHPWFRDARSSSTATYRDWYVWRTDDPGWTQPWGGGPTWHKTDGGYYYGLFWSGMPDLNFRNPAVRDEVNRLAGLWLDRGVDGFRLDATRHLVEAGAGDGQTDTDDTHAALRLLSASVRLSHPDALLVGENWTSTDHIARFYGSTAKVAGGDELPASFNFPLAAAIVDGVRSGSADGVKATLHAIRAAYPPGVIDATFLTNHDMPRLATQLDADPRKERLAAAVLLTLPGTPFVYYGEEVGLRNGPGRNDEYKRTPMPWDTTPGGGFTTGKPWFVFAPGRDEDNVATQSTDPTSLWTRYRTLIHLRQRHAALRNGTLTLLEPAAGPSMRLLAFLREAPGERVLVAHAFGTDGPVTATLTLDDVAGVEPLFTDSGATCAPAGRIFEVTLPAGSSGVWRLRGR
jgi:glycosidase